MKIKSIHHIKLTVRNLEISKKFYEKLPGFKVVAEYDDFVMFSCGNFYFGLTTNKTQNEQNFSEFRVGLDHLSFEIDNIIEAQEFLENNSITHSEIQKLTNGIEIIVFRDPDNIQLEFCMKK